MIDLNQFNAIVWHTLPSYQVVRQILPWIWLYVKRKNSFTEIFKCYLEIVLQNERKVNIIIAMIKDGKFHWIVLILYERTVWLSVAWWHCISRWRAPEWGKKVVYVLLFSYISITWLVTLCRESIVYASILDLCIDET